MSICADVDGFIHLAAMDDDVGVPPTPTGIHCLLPDDMIAIVGGLDVVNMPSGIVRVVS